MRPFFLGVVLGGDRPRPAWARCVFPTLFLAAFGRAGWRLDLRRWTSMPSPERALAPPITPKMRSGGSRVHGLTGGTITPESRPLLGATFLPRWAPRYACLTDDRGAPGSRRNGVNWKLGLNASGHAAGRGPAGDGEWAVSHQGKCPNRGRQITLSQMPRGGGCRKARSERAENRTVQALLGPGAGSRGAPGLPSVHRTAIGGRNVRLPDETDRGCPRANQ